MAVVSIFFHGCTYSTVVFVAGEGQHFMVCCGMHGWIKINGIHEIEQHTLQCRSLWFPCHPSAVLYGHLPWPMTLAPGVHSSGKARDGSRQELGYQRPFS